MTHKSRLTPWKAPRPTAMIAALALALSLAACGKKSPLEPPPGYKAPEKPQAEFQEQSAAGPSGS